ncbi:hypothetical protein AcV5_010173 [Taiwanofungus camphoratus]|nr:hypothetical protein AcV5_010173 [Antrodia cinnamomea]
MSQESYYLNGMASFDEDAEAYAFIATENPLAEWERVLAEVTLASDGFDYPVLPMFPPLDIREHLFYLENQMEPPADPSSPASSTGPQGPSDGSSSSSPSNEPMNALPPPVPSTGFNPPTILPVPQQPVEGSQPISLQAAHHSDVPAIAQINDPSSRSPTPPQSSAPSDTACIPLDAAPTRSATRPRTARRKRPCVDEGDTEPQAGPSQPVEHCHHRRRRRRLNDGNAIAVADPPPPPPQPVAGPSTEPMDPVSQCSWRGCREHVSRDSAWRHFRAAHLGEAQNGRITCQHPSCLTKGHRRDMSVSNMKRHYEADLDFRTYTCPYCGAEFKRGDMRNRHMEHHCRVCPHCLQDFSSSTARNEHCRRCPFCRPSG